VAPLGLLNNNFPPNLKDRGVGWREEGGGDARPREVEGGRSINVGGGWRCETTLGPRVAWVTVEVCISRLLILIPRVTIIKRRQVMETNIFEIRLF